MIYELSEEVHWRTSFKNLNVSEIQSKLYKNPHVSYLMRFLHQQIVLTFIYNYLC